MTTYLKPDAIIALHFLKDGAAWSYAWLASKVGLSLAHAVDLANDLHKLGLVDMRTSTVQITAQGKQALKLGTVES